MTTYYVGPGGNNGNAGTSWALRKLTLNGAEDIPVAAGDTVYVGPGVYRELLTCDVAGSSGSPITYIADVTGANTDGVGGIVRITGSDNDTTATRNNCIIATTKDFRTFRGFAFDMSAQYTISATTCEGWIIEDCYFVACGTGGYPNIYFNGADINNTIRRCYFAGPRYGGNRPIEFAHTTTADNCGHLVENCVIIGGGAGVWSTRVGGITVKNCTILFNGTAVRVGTALTVGQTVTVNNCIMSYCGTAFQATATGEITENYNALFFNGTDRTNTNTGANSNAYPHLTHPVMLYSGLNMPIGNLATQSEWGQLNAIAGTGESTDDLYGITRPTTSAKKSWGAVQYDQHDRETTTVDAGSVSLKLADAGYRQFIIPVGNVSTTFTVKCYREADYAGTNPQIIIKQPGVADNTTTDAGSASAWNTLSVTLTPAASPDYVIVELRSNNTATSGNYDVFFDTFTAAAALDPNGMEYWIADRTPLPQLAETEVAGGGLLTHPGMAGGING